MRLDESNKAIVDYLVFHCSTIAGAYLTFSNHNLHGATFCEAMPSLIGSVKKRLELKGRGA